MIPFIERRDRACRLASQRPMMLSELPS